MWPFGFGNKYPYTNFHELNLDWILDQIGHLTNSVKELYKKMEDFFIDTTPIIEDTVNTWLDDHPEATTTVQDGSITVEKFNESVVDATLTESGHPADAKVVGDMLIPTNGNFNKMLNEITTREGEGSPAIFACAMSWAKHNNELFYGQGGECNSFQITGDHTITPAYAPPPNSYVDGKYKLDCMTFVDMCLRGIGFEDSAYGNGSNMIRYPCTTINWISWNFAKYAFAHNSNVSDVPYFDYTPASWTGDNNYYKVTTFQYARFLRDHGLYTHIGGTYITKARQMLRPGDILFFGNPNDDQFDDRFDSIYHCGIFVGWSRDENPIIMDCTDGDYSHPIRVRVGTGSHAANRIMGYARIPLGACGTSGLEEKMDLLVNKGSYAHRYNNTDTFRLTVRSKLWNVYKVTVAYMYTDSRDISASFPSIYWGASGYHLNRLTPNTQQAKEINKWYVSDMVVCLDIDHAHFTEATITDINDYFRATFYPAPTGTVYIKCLKVSPIVLDPESGLSPERYELRDTYASGTFASWSDMVQYFADHYAGFLENGDTMDFAFRSVEVAGSGEITFIKIIKMRSDCYKIAAWNNACTGATLFKEFGESDPVINTYTANTFPIESWMK